MTKKQFRTFHYQLWDNVAYLIRTAIEQECTSSFELDDFKEHALKSMMHYDSFSEFYNTLSKEEKTLLKRVSCFACLYAEQKKKESNSTRHRCEFCPLLWGTELQRTKKEGYYCGRNESPYMELIALVGDYFDEDHLPDMMELCETIQYGR